MQMKVTEKNIKQIYGLLNKSLSNKKFKTVWLYPTSVRRNNNKKLINYYNRLDHESSYITFYLTSKVDFIWSEYFNQYYILIRNLYDSSEIKYKSFIIDIGNEITFKGDVILLKKQHPTKSKEKAIQKITILK